MKPNGFCSFPFAKPRPFSCRSKCVCPSCDTHIFPVSRADRYNTLHLCSKGCVPKGGLRPLWEPLVLSDCGHTSHFCSCALSSKTAKTKANICLPIRQIFASFLRLRPHTQPEEIASLFVNRNGNLQAKLSEAISIPGLYYSHNRVIMNATHIGGFSNERNG